MNNFALNLVSNLETKFVKFCDKFYKWFTASGVEYREQSEYMYKSMHLIILFSVLAITLITYFLLKNKSEKVKRIFLLTISWLLIACEMCTRLSKIFFHIELNQLTTAQLIKDVLPMHFCQIIIWVVILSIMFNNKNLMSFGAICGIIGCTIYLLYPIEGLDHSFFNVRMLNSPLTHGLGFVASVNMLLWGMVSLNLGDLWKTYTLLTIIVIYGIIMNLIFPGENYMFLMTNPTPIEFKVIPYQIVFGLVIMAFIGCTYLIAHYIDKAIEKRKEENKNNSSNEEQLKMEI